MIPFLSSTLLDLVQERAAVLAALRKKRLLTRAMEDFLASPAPPSEIALEQLRLSDVMILVIGSKAGSLLPDGSGSTYTSAEYDEAMRTGTEPLVFVKVTKAPDDEIGRWHNDETDDAKRTALDKFKTDVTQRWTPAYFDSPEKLALEVILALDDWEQRGRPGARKTFASTQDFFAGKNAPGHFALLDFGTTLLGRDSTMDALAAFAGDDSQRVCILSGAGGIGKSKVLHDWAETQGEDVLFLKDEPLWHEGSGKEVPVSCKTIVIDDAHRNDHLNRVLQLMLDKTGHQPIKLILSTRPGGSARLQQQVARHVDRMQVTELPELKELTKTESRQLARQTLCTEFEHHADHLAEIGSNSPLVIVAGGRLIAARKIHPAALTTLAEFRSTVFNRLLDDMDLQGPRFPIDARKLLHLIAALGPIDVESRDFRGAAQRFFNEPVDEILATVDGLALAGIVTPRQKPVRVVPDVLADYLLEERCINPDGRSTGYADRVYDQFGASSLKNLMRNLAELDWRRGHGQQSQLNLLDDIWADIFSRFRSADEFDRGRVLDELAGAAIYQPDRILKLVRFALDHPIVVPDTDDLSFFRMGQAHVLVAVPPLLEATAHHPTNNAESVQLLWKLSKNETSRHANSNDAQGVLKRLSAWHRYGDPALNFAMLIQAIRLSSREDAFASDFTPFTLISQILERDGEFNEWQSEDTISFGGFGLNYRAVGPVRENALDFLETSLSRSDSLAVRAIPLLEKLLHNFLNRVGRQTTDDEKVWQKSERERCVDILVSRLHQPASPLLRARLFDALRSGTAINCPEYVRTRIADAIAGFRLDDAAAVIDAICTADHMLPILSKEFSEKRWEGAIGKVMSTGRTALERLIGRPVDQASYVIGHVQTCLELRIKTGGFHRFMLTFQDRPAFLHAMADQVIGRPDLTDWTTLLGSVFTAIHVSEPAEYRKRALAALSTGSTPVIRAAATNLRVFSGAEKEDIEVVKAYAGYPDQVAKRGAAFAIAYMGKFAELGEELKAAALSIRTEGDGHTAAELADAFGFHGVPLTSLTRAEAAMVAREFLYVRDWDVDQGAVTRFLVRFSEVFPDEVFDLLLHRCELNEKAAAEGTELFRTFHLVYDNDPFSRLSSEKRNSLGRQALNKLALTRATEEISDLFWQVVAADEGAFDLILEWAQRVKGRAVKNLAVLLDKAETRLVFTHTGFVKRLLSLFNGPARERLVTVLAKQARRLDIDGLEEHPERNFARSLEGFKEQLRALPDDPTLHDLHRALSNLCS